MKRGLSILLSIVMIFLMMTPALAAFTYEESLHVITSLGYAADTSAEQEITRGEAADMLVNLMELGYLAPENAEIPYQDVSTQHTYYKGIASALQLGMISYDTEFRPDDKITYAEMVKMIVSMLGYNDVAMDLGGYPAGYVLMAQRLEVLSGIGASSEDIVTSQDAMVMLYNTFCATVREPVKFTAVDGAIFYNGENKLYQYLGYEMIEDIVVANSISSLSGPMELEEGMVAIGDTDNLFYVGDTDIADYLGYNVYVFYKVLAGEKKEIQTFYVDPDNKTLTIDYDAAPFAYIENDRIVIEYWTESGRVRLVETDAERIIYNGVCTTADATDDSLEKIFGSFQGGTVTLIANDVGSVYDVIKIDRPISGVVTRVDAEDNILYYKDYAIAGHEIAINFDKNAKVKVYTPEGEESELANIGADTVVSIYASEDMMNVKILTSLERVKGTLSRKNSKGEYFIENTAYKLWNTFPESLIPIGTYGDFHINAEGFIVGINKSNINYNYYGLLMDVSDSKVPKIKVLTSEGELKVFECEEKIWAYNGTAVAKTKFENLICYTKVEEGYNNVPKYMLWYENNAANFTYDTDGKYGEGKAFYWRPGLNESDKSDAASRKPIYYELNDKGKVRKIIVPDIPIAEENKLTSLNADNDGFMDFWTYRNADPSIATPVNGGKAYRISSNAIAYSCLARTYEEEDYKYAGAHSYFADGLSRKFHLYSIEDSGNVDFMVGYNHLPTEDTKGMALVMIENVNECIDDVYEIEGMAANDKFSITVKGDLTIVERDLQFKNGSAYEPLTASNILDVLDGKKVVNKAVLDDKRITFKQAGLKAGDIILLGMDRNDEVSFIEVVLRGDRGVNQITSAAGKIYTSRISNSAQIEKGIVTKCSDGFYNVRVINEYNEDTARTTVVANENVGKYYDETTLVRFSYSSCRIIEMDYATGKAKKVSHTTLREGDAVLYMGPTYKPTYCMILRNNPIEPDYGTYWKEDTEDSGDSGDATPLRPAEFALDSTKYHAAFNVVNLYTSAGKVQFNSGNASGMYMCLPFASSSKLSYNGTLDEIDKIMLDITFDCGSTDYSSSNTLGIYLATKDEMGTGGFSNKVFAPGLPAATTPSLTFEVPKLQAKTSAVVSIDITDLAKTKFCDGEDMYIFIRRVENIGDNRMRMHCVSGTNGSGTPATLRISYKEVVETP